MTGGDSDGLLAAIDRLPDAATVPVGFVRTFLDPAHAPDDALQDLTLEQAAELFGRSVSTARTWCQSGKLRGAYRFEGREWRIPRASIRDFLAAQRNGAPTVQTTVPSRTTVDLGAWKEGS